MGKFTFTQTEIPGVVVIEPQVFGDDRGYFMETYQKDQFAEAGIDKEFVQDNQSRSTRGVLRGLHFQKNHTQGKLVRVTRGEVYDVAVDCRPNSATFGKWVGVTLSEENKKMFYIPEGFAHGFLVLSDVAEFCYKCTDVYDPTQMTFSIGGFNMQQIIKLNPMYWYITGFRRTLMWGIPLDINMFLVCGLCALVSMLIGVQMFRKTQDRFVLHI